MDDIRYSTENSPQDALIREVHGLTQWIIRSGLAPDEVGARKVMLITAVVAIAVAMLLFVFKGDGSAQAPETTFTVSPNESVGSQQGLPQ